MLLAVVAFLMFAFIGLNAQVKVTTTTGETYVGSVVDENMERIMLLTADSVTITVPKINVRMVQYGLDPIPSRAKIDPGASFWSFGATLGTPAIVNLVLGYNFNEWGVRASGGMIPETSIGFQVDIRRSIGTSGSLSHNLHVGAGALVMDDGNPFRSYDWWDYIAIGYDMNWSGFYLSADISSGEGTYSNPQFLAQVGYVHEFR